MYSRHLLTSDYLMSAKPMINLSAVDAARFMAPSKPSPCKNRTSCKRCMLQYNYGDAGPDARYSEALFMVQADDAYVKKAKQDDDTSGNAPSYRLNMDISNNPDLVRGANEINRGVYYALERFLASDYRFQPVDSQGRPKDYREFDFYSCVFTPFGDDGMPTGKTYLTLKHSDFNSTYEQCAPIMVNGERKVKRERTFKVEELVDKSFKCMVLFSVSDMFSSAALRSLTVRIINCTILGPIKDKSYVDIKSNPMMLEFLSLMPSDEWEKMKEVGEASEEESSTQLVPVSEQEPAPMPSYARPMPNPFMVNVHDI